MYKHNWDIICVLLITLQNVFVSVMLEKKLKPFFLLLLKTQIAKSNQKAKYLKNH